jgi:hypothetical protein
VHFLCAVHAPAFQYFVDHSWVIFFPLPALFCLECYFVCAIIVLSASTNNKSLEQMAEHNHGPNLQKLTTMVEKGSKQVNVQTSRVKHMDVYDRPTRNIYGHHYHRKVRAA